MRWFDLLFPHLFLKLCSSGLKLIQSLLQIGHFLFDLAQLSLVLATRQVVRPKLCGNVLLKLAPQDPEIGIPPYRSLSVFKSAGLNASHDEVPAHSIFLLRRDVAESSAFAILLTVFCHISSLRSPDPVAFALPRRHRMR